MPNIELGTRDVNVPKAQTPSSLTSSTNICDKLVSIKNLECNK